MDDQYVDYDEYINSPLWAKKREEAFAFYGRICGHCKATEKLHVHHWTYRHLGREPMCDLAVLCESCHKRVHRDEYARARRLVAREIQKYDLAKAPPTAWPIPVADDYNDEQSTIAAELRADRLMSEMKAIYENIHAKVEILTERNQRSLINDPVATGAVKAYRDVFQKMTDILVTDWGVASRLYADPGAAKT